MTEVSQCPWTLVTWHCFDALCQSLALSQKDNLEKQLCHSSQIYIFFPFRSSYKQNLLDIQKSVRGVVDKPDATRTMGMMTGQGRTGQQPAGQ